jgi:hypothetical protein
MSPSNEIVTTCAIAAAPFSIFREFTFHDSEGAWSFAALHHKRYTHVPLQTRRDALGGLERLLSVGASEELSPVTVDVTVNRDAPLPN